MSLENLVELTRAYRNTTEYDGGLPGQGLREQLANALAKGAHGDVRLYRPIQEEERADVRVYFLSTDAYKLVREFLDDSNWATDRQKVELNKLREIDLT